MKSFLVSTFLALLSISPIIGERYNVFYGEKFPYVENEQGHRFMQLDTGNRPDINATDDTCRLVGPSFQCFIGTRIMGPGDTYSDLNVKLFCNNLDPEIATDFRRKPCACQVEVVSSDGTKKDCECQTCPDGYGPSPISIDCQQEKNEENPYVISSCTNMDCNFGCVGIAII